VSGAFEVVSGKILSLFQQAPRPLDTNQRRQEIVDVRRRGQVIILRAGAAAIARPRRSRRP
jgi:hypothetical protein